MPSTDSQPPYGRRECALATSLKLQLRQRCALHCPDFLAQTFLTRSVLSEIEITRKKYIESLTKRSEHEIAEEEALFIEIKRLEQDERRFARSREELLRVFAGAESGLPSVAIEDEAGAAILGEGKNKKKKGATGAGGSAGGMEVDSPVSAQGVISLGPPQTPTKKTPGLVPDAAYGGCRISYIHKLHANDIPRR